MSRRAPLLRFSLLLFALVVALAGSTTACDRVEIRTITTTTTVERTEEAVFVTAFSPRFFERASSVVHEHVGEAAAWSWTDASINTTLEGDIELNLGTLDADFSLSSLSVTPGDGVLDVTAIFDAAPVLTRVRIGPPEDTILCALNVDLQKRTLAFTLRPDLNSDILAWEATAIESLTATQLISHSLPTACPYPVDELDWEMLSERVDALLAGEVATELLPKMKELVARELSLPSAGFLLLSSTTGFFEPMDVSLATSISKMPPWPGDAMTVSPEGGLRVAFDMGLNGATAPCVGELSATSLATSPVRASDIPDTTPSGTAYDQLVVLDMGMVTAIIEELTISGYGCGDLLFAAFRGLPALNTVVPELDDAKDFNFGRDGRLRVQQLALPSLHSPSAGHLEWVLPRIRYSLYAMEDDVVIGLSTVTAAMRVDVTPTIDSSGTLRFAVNNVDASEVSADVAFLEAEGQALDGATIAERLTTALFETGLGVPISEPFGFPMAVVDVEERAGALWIYFDLESSE